MRAYNHKDYKKCNEYLNFYLFIGDTIYFHPDFSSDINESIIMQINNNNCKSIQFVNKVDNIKHIEGTQSFLLTKSHCYDCKNFKKVSIFDKEIDFSKCESVKKISFGSSFNKSIDNKLPFLEILEF